MVKFSDKITRRSKAAGRWETEQGGNTLQLV